ncbi:MAG TPA: nicotinate-nucleotide adenylyltransferase [Candidatus Acidoferrales bacterium]|nr:nicotinate-nucleotide adenylyltransferase [Candidatus Acidoferrales bacterium]
MRTGLFGGTFDPIHWAHLRSAEEAREAFDLDRVLFVPAAVPPHKKKQPLSTPEERAQMVRLAIAGHPQFDLCTIELERSGKSYTVDTLRELAARSRGEEYYFIIGRDAFSEIGSWKEFREIFALCNFIVTSRPGAEPSAPFPDLPVAVRELFCYEEKKRAYRHQSGTYIYFLRITDIAISASEIRKHVAAGRSIRYLVPSEVEGYIKEKGLYRRKVTPR